MSLYGSLGLLPEGENKQAAQTPVEKPAAAEPLTKALPGWSANIKMLAPQLNRKKPEAHPKPVAKAVPKTTVTVVQPVPESEIQPIKEPFYDSAIVLSNIKDEYNPSRPNDYESIARKLEAMQQVNEEEEEYRQQEEAKRRTGTDRRYAAIAPPPELLSTPAAAPPPVFRPPSPPQPQRPSSPPKPAITQNELKLSGEEAYLRRLRMSAPQAAAPVAPQAQIKQEDTGGVSFGAKLLARYGWKDGQGLGKTQQGMNAPLSVSRTGVKTGTIVNESNNARVVLLMNMVGAGEVDGDLVPETAEECSKFGRVQNCVVYEAPAGTVPDSEAVRIFVEFEDDESAKRAISSMNGRFFGGRSVRALLYDVEMFHRGHYLAAIH